MRRLIGETVIVWKQLPIPAKKFSVDDFDIDGILDGAENKTANQLPTGVGCCPNNTAHFVHMLNEW